MWLDGQREEIQLKFTAAERAHPINWRELLGIVRVAKAWGARLRGARLLVETDSMVAYEVGRRSRARVAAMQELVRRLVDCCERHDIELALTHTPGVKLDRPDQTSRGDAVEEPRQRLGAQLFGELISQRLRLRLHLEEPHRIPRKIHEEYLQHARATNSHLSERQRQKQASLDTRWGLTVAARSGGQHTHCE